MVRLQQLLSWQARHPTSAASIPAVLMAIWFAFSTSYVGAACAYIAALVVVLARIASASPPNAVRGAAFIVLGWQAVFVPLAVLLLHWACPEVVFDNDAAQSVAFSVDARQRYTLAPQGRLVMRLPLGRHRIDIASPTHESLTVDLPFAKPHVLSLPGARCFRLFKPDGPKRTQLQHYRSGRSESTHEYVHGIDKLIEGRWVRISAAADLHRRTCVQ